MAALRSLTQCRSVTNRILPLVFVLLVLFASTAEATHVHPDGSKLPQHRCSICSAAHNGVRTERVFVPSRLVTYSESVGTSDEVPGCLLVIPSITIRPPPSV
jgi:hypothetical protein